MLSNMQTVCEVESCFYLLLKQRCFNYYIIKECKEFMLQIPQLKFSIFLFIKTELNITGKWKGEKTLTLNILLRVSTDVTDNK